jgi:hypothetical protein
LRSGRPLGSSRTALRGTTLEVRGPVFFLAFQPFFLYKCAVFFVNISRIGPMKMWLDFGPSFLFFFIYIGFGLFLGWIFVFVLLLHGCELYLVCAMYGPGRALFCSLGFTPLLLHFFFFWLIIGEYDRH